MRIIWAVSAALILAGGASLLPGPYAATVQTPRGPLLESSLLDSASIASIEHACGNCHSNNTHWPWYSHLAPISWMLRKDVSEGRTFLNFSSWPAYGPEGQSQLLALAASRLLDQSMPPSRYLALHPESRLKPAERQSLAAALSREANRLSTTKP